MRMQIEELMFEEKFGDEYVKYLADRYRLIPFIY